MKYIIVFVLVIFCLTINVKAASVESNAPITFTTKSILIRNPMVISIKDVSLKNFSYKIRPLTTSGSCLVYATTWVSCTESWNNLPLISNSISVNFVQIPRKTIFAFLIQNIKTGKTVKTNPITLYNGDIASTYIGRLNKSIGK